MNIFRHDKEEAIVRLFGKGDSTAMDELYAYAADSLAGVASRYVVGDEVKDVLQESFIKIFTRIGDFQYRGKGSLMAWMTRIVINEALQCLRSHKAAPTVELSMDVPDADDEPPDLHGLSNDDIVEAIGRLPDGYRAVFNLYVVEGKSHKEIAELLNIKPDTSASQLHRAKSLLAKMLKDKVKQLAIQSNNQSEGILDE
jgi:RNA polymerase sigma factor (sigma-70 family)